MLYAIAAAAIAFTAPGLAPTGPLGPAMAQDFANGLDHKLLAAIAKAGRFGAPARCQLFVGAAAAAGARTVLHYDQYDNVFLQLSGRKTFLLFDPLQTGKLAPYPIHHPLDRSCRVGMETPLREQTGSFSRAGLAGGCRVTLEPGDVLVLPAYHWHEVITEPSSGGDAASDELTVSLNFWFSPMHRLLEPQLPLSPMLRVELARQAEFFLCDALDDQPTHVPIFLAALNKQLEAIENGACDERARTLATGAADPVLWAELHAKRPAGVAAAHWEGLFEYMLAKASHLLGPAALRPFAADLLDPERFIGLERTK